MSLLVEHSPTGHVTIISLFGEHDIATALDVRRALRDKPGRLTVVDLARCTFIDSTIIAVFIAAAKRAASHRGRVALCNVHGIPARAVEITGADRAIEVFYTEPPRPTVTTHILDYPRWTSA